MPSDLHRSVLEMSPRGRKRGLPAAHQQYHQQYYPQHNQQHHHRQQEQQQSQLQQHQYHHSLPQPYYNHQQQQLLQHPQQHNQYLYQFQQLQQQSQQQQQQPPRLGHERPPPLMHPELDFTSPAFRGIIDDSPFRPPPRSMDRPAQPFQRAPAPAPAPPTDDPHSEDCSSCCDDDNCDDKCENDDCTTDGCDDCVDTCAGAVPCPGSPCSPISAPCAQGPCQAVVVCEDEACPVESGAVEILCREGSCQEEDCHTEPCEATCPGLECRETFCPDFSRPVTADRAAAHIPQAPQHMHSGQNCVSYHVNNANSNRWEQQKHHTYYPEAASQFSNISPGNLSLSTAHHLPPFGSLLRTGEYGNAFGDGFPMSLIDMSMPPLQPPPKRRRVSDATPISTPTFDHSYSTTPSSAAQTPITTNYGDVYCLWEDSCEETFFDNVTLHDHIWAAHIGADIDSSNGNGKRCLWDGCGQESSGPIGLLDHVKISHAPLPVKHVCMWADCNAILNSEEGLQKHIDRAHLTSGNQCQWDACDKLAPTEVDLEKHVHSHLATHSDMELDPVAPEGDKTCEWQEDDGHRNIIRCGLDFPTSTELQQHAKDDHIAVLRKKTGYFCHWAGCTRRDKPFSQKGKVERHLQTHTGFKSCRCATCGKEFSAPQALQQHIRTHTGEKPYKCDICNKEFAQGSAMTMHKRVHTGERPLHCDFPGCGKRFSESSNLSKHRKTHNPVGQHSCSFPGCERSFHRLDQMKRHQKTHGVVISGSVTESP